MQGRLRRVSTSSELEYNILIENARSQNRRKLDRTNPNYIYYENHHIIPKSIGGSDSKNNMVLLTYSEHIQAHQLLCDMYPSEWRLAYALIRLLTSSSALKCKRKASDLTSEELKMLEDAKEKASLYISEKNKLSWKDEKYRKKLSSLTRDRWANYSYKENIQKKMKAYAENPEVRKRLSDVVRAAQNRPESKKRLSFAAKKQWEDPAMRLRMSENCKKAVNTPEYKKKLQESKIISVYSQLIHSGYTPTDATWDECILDYAKFSGKRREDLRKYFQVKKYFGSVHELEREFERRQNAKF